MGSKICMNASCGATTTHEWKRGWLLRSGGYAHLCYSCGSAFENSVYCDTFHLGESGWRECRMCSKHLHCGCIASKSVFELLDYGGVGCTNCVKSSHLHSVQSDELPNGFGPLTIDNACQLESSARLENRLVGDGNDGGKLAQLSRPTETNESCQSERDDSNSCFGPFREDFMHGIREAGPGLSNVTQPLVGTPKFTKPDNIRSMLEMRDIHGSVGQPSLSMTLGGPSSSRSFVPFSSGTFERKEQANAPFSLQQGQKPRLILPKPAKPGFAMSSEANKVVVSDIRIARPPGEGRGKNQLLPRYWPRITDQELQQLSGDLNSTIVPLFEKVLSASDAGRIGRLVLPKACAEAYFPHISQSEGVPLRIQDVKGREWTFQFRFWPNNNSRMYVLEGVTPCIQSMQLQAGDTITFSRIDPGGKLVVGFRKATNNTLDTPDAEAIFPNGSTSGETSFSGTVDTLGTDGDFGWNKSESPGAKINGDLRSAMTTEKKRTRNIGPKSKRLLMHSEDAMELRLTWEEAQDLLRPPPSAMPVIVTIEDHEIEEYDEPPVFGKKTIFTVRPSGGREQWAQCDDCSKWRKLPSDALLPPRWTCSDNVWDSSRCTCAASQELSLKDLDNLLRLSKDFKRRKIMESHKPLNESEPTGLDALASAAALGASIGDLGETSVGATTRHPRHRAGCSCIVCSQPPSGKGRHPTTCTCNVCLTVRRRFKTLMLRKKKRQSEREAAKTAQKEMNERKEPMADDSRKENDGSEMVDTLGHETPHINNPGNEDHQSRNQPVSEISTGQIDLNTDPNRDDGHLGPTELSSMHPADAPPNLPFDSYGKQSDIPNVMCEQASLSLRRLSDEAFLASVGWDHESRRG